jgi:hypothetical protein
MDQNNYPREISNREEYQNENTNNFKNSLQQ